MKNKNYDEFVEKFKPKKTTDDCYTPENIYNAVASWVAKEYELFKNDFVRPFYPGGDYKNFDYTGKIVVDNPPFSIMSEIVHFYIANNIKFFLFAPTLTSFNLGLPHCTILSIGLGVIYENGAKVNTSFVTNLEPFNIRIRTVPELYQIIDAENKKNIQLKHKQLPKYKYPINVITAAQIGKYSKYGIELVIPRNKSEHIRSLNSQKAFKKAIYGSGYIIADDVALQVKRAEEKSLEKNIHTIQWELDSRELEIIKRLNNN